MDDIGEINVIGLDDDWEFDLQRPRGVLCLPHGFI
jgi:hypothetical protein